MNIRHNEHAAATIDRQRETADKGKIQRQDMRRPFLDFCLTGERVVPHDRSRAQRSNDFDRSQFQASFVVHQVFPAILVLIPAASLVVKFDGLAVRPFGLVLKHCFCFRQTAHLAMLEEGQRYALLQIRADRQRGHGAGVLARQEDKAIFDAKSRIKQSPEIVFRVFRFPKIECDLL